MFRIMPVAFVVAACALHMASAQAEKIGIHLESAAKKGMTWGVQPHHAADRRDVTLVSCHGQPKIEGQSCNAYAGDTACSLERPVLCLNVDGRPRPDAAAGSASKVPAGNDFYSGWAGGRIALTRAVRGDQFASQDEANAWCASNFGEGWRMAEHHDGWTRDGSKGGWGFMAQGRIPSGSRFWVAINDQPANCWD